MKNYKEIKKFALNLLHADFEEDMEKIFSEVEKKVSEVKAKFNPPQKRGEFKL